MTITINTAKNNVRNFTEKMCLKLRYKKKNKGRRRTQKYRSIEMELDGAHCSTGERTKNGLKKSYNGGRENTFVTQPHIQDDY